MILPNPLLQSIHMAISFSMLIFIHLFRFPLYPRGVDNTRFEYAVFLLNKNVEQILNSQGIDAKNLRNTLPNLLEFLKVYCHQL